MAIRKKFVDVQAPILDREIRVLGTPESLQNKTIKLDLTRKLKGRGLELVLEIQNKENPTAYPKKISLIKSYLRRMMRKRVNYVEDSFKTPCADIEATIKPFLITRKKVSRAVRNNLRKTTKEFIKEYLKEKNYIEVCDDILTGALQKQMLPKLKKVYPLSFCEIRVIETKDLANANLESTQKDSQEPEEPTETKEIEPETSEEPKKEKSTTKKTTKKKTKKSTTKKTSKKK